MIVDKLMYKAKVVVAVFFIVSAFYIGKYVKEKNNVTAIAVNSVGYQHFANFQKNILLLVKLNDLPIEKFNSYHSNIFWGKLSDLESKIHVNENEHLKMPLCVNLRGYRDYFISRKNITMENNMLIIQINSMLKNCDKRK